MKNAPKKFYIDTKRLEERGACFVGTMSFERAFPKAALGAKVDFTYENWEKARKGRLNLGWLAEKIIGLHRLFRLEDAHRGPLFNMNGYYSKRFGDKLFAAIKEELESR